MYLLAVYEFTVMLGISNVVKTKALTRVKRRLSTPNQSRCTLQSLHRAQAIALSSLRPSLFPVGLLGIQFQPAAICPSRNRRPATECNLGCVHRKRSRFFANCLASVAAFSLLPIDFHKRNTAGHALADRV